MAVCDICNAPGIGRIISAENIRQAVFENGFDPYALGLINTVVIFGGITNAKLENSAAETYEMWKKSIVAQDTSDWNICPSCMVKLEPYLKGTPKPTGVTQGTLSTNPTVWATSAAAAEQKYKKVRKWWQFWKCE